MTAIADAPRIARGRDSRAEKNSGNSVADVDKTLAQWEKFLAKRPGCDTGFAAAPGQAMRAINVSSAAQVPMILRELHRTDGTIRINFPSSADPKVTQDQVKIRTFLQEHHGKDLASLKSELVTLLTDSHSFRDLKDDKTFKKSFASAEQWIDANFSGIASSNSTLDVTDVISVKGAAEKREAQVTGVIASLQESVTAGRGAVVTISHEDAGDQELKDVIRTKLGETSGIDASMVKVWIGAEAGMMTKKQLNRESVREISLAKFLASTGGSPQATACGANDDLVVGSSRTSAEKVASKDNPLTTGTSPEPSGGTSLADLRIGTVARYVASTEATTEVGPTAAYEPTTKPAQATELKVGVAVGNHRRGYDQEDRHLARSFPTMDASQAEKYLRHSVAAMDEVTKDNKSGSTFTGVIVTEDGNLVTAHLGDSPASAVIIGKDGNLKAVVPLIEEHKPGHGNGVSSSGREFLDNGAYRITTADQNGVEKRIGVAMTRSLGNVAFGDVLSHEPELHVHEIQQRLQDGDRLFLLVTSDGAHNEGVEITHQNHGRTIADRLRESASLTEISDQIAVNSAPIRDNVTVTLLEVETGRGAIVAVFDGHGGSETSDHGRRVLLDLTEQFDQQGQPTTIEELASAVTLDERLKSLRRRLDDAYELRGDFIRGAELVESEENAKAKLSVVARIRELQTLCLSKTGEEGAALRQEMLAIYEEYEMSVYGQSGHSFEQNVDTFEADWKSDLADIAAKIEQYNDRTLVPAMERMKREIAEIEKKTPPRE
jgi:serine/threonine protein phosphatase PrpC